MKTIKSENRQHFIFEDGVKIAGPFPSNAAAWRVIEKLEGEPVNAAESRKMWSQKKWLSE